MWSTRIAFALLFLQPIAFFRHVLINPKFHIPWDIEGFHLPLMAAIARTWRQGEWPWWNTLIYCGYPLHADVQAQIFYPPAWIVIAVRNWTGRENILYSLEWMVVLHMSLAGLLMGWLLRRMEASVPAALFGGTVFQVGAYFASQAQHVGAVCAAAWLPLAWLAIYELRERWNGQWLAALAFALSMSFLSGFMAATVIVYAATGLFGLAMVATRLASVQLLLRLGAGVAWSVALAAVLLWPALELTQLSFAKLRADWGAGLGGIPFVAWWGLLWPDAVGVFTPLDPKKYTLPYNFTFLYLYCGLGVVLAAIWVLVRGDRRMRIFLGIALAFLVLGAGDRVTGLRPMIETIAPRSIRGALYVEFSPAAMTAALAVMGGLALARLRWTWMAWLVAVATMAELHWAGSRRPMNTAEQSWRMSSSESNLDGSRKLVSNLAKLVNVAEPPWRLDMLDLNFNFSMAAPLRPFPTAGGDSPFAPEDVLEIRRQFAGGNYWERAIPVAKPESPWLDFLNVGVLVAEKIKEDPAALEKAGWPAVEGGEWMRLYRNAEVRPRCYAASKVRAVANEAEAKRALAEVDFRDEVVVEGQAPSRVGPAEVRFESYRDNEVVLRVKAAGPAFIVCSETFYPGWRATIDDRETPILRTNRAFRGIALPAGDHRVRMAFTPTRMYAGGVVTVAALLGVIVALWRGR